MRCRKAILNVSRQLLEEILPPGREIKATDTVSCTPDTYAWLVDVLKLPSETRITGIDLSRRFQWDEVSIRLEHPSFVTVAEGCMIPEVRASYGCVGNGPAYFRGWEFA